MSELEDYSLEEGEYLVALARRSMETYLREGRRIPEPPDAPERLRAMRGAFVTLRTHPGGELRGCIGRPYPAQPLVRAVIDSAIDAAVNDPRFEPMSAEEADRVTVEVSVLTEPKDVHYRSPLELKGRVKVGRDGLIVIWSMGSGLLLPQVPVEEGWDVEEYLSYACMKAGAPPDCWLTMRPRIQAFQAVVFEEVSPRGEVVKRSLEGARRRLRSRVRDRPGARLQDRRGAKGPLVQGAQLHREQLGRGAELPLVRRGAMCGGPGTRRPLG
jgi:uncharacterized protein (TIGR00296 family)